MPAKMVRSRPQPPFRASTVMAAVRATRLSCQNEDKALKLPRKREPSGESRINCHGEHLLRSRFLFLLPADRCFADVLRHFSYRLSAINPHISITSTMPVLLVFSHVVLVATAGVLFYAAFTDLKHYTIKNEIILVLAGLFFLHAFLSGRWGMLHWNVGFALLMFGLLFFAYARNMMGGGDLKILTVALLWVGLNCALPFALLLFVFGALHSLAAKLGWVAAQHMGGRIRIAFAPSVAAALIGTFMLGCLHPLP